MAANRGIHGDDCLIRFASEAIQVGELATPFLRQSVTSRIYQDLSHHPRSNAVKVRPVPTHASGTSVVLMYRA